MKTKECIRRLMNISEVNVTPVKPNNGLVAIASIVIDEAIYLNSIAVLTKLDGSYRLLYPTKHIGVRSMNIFHPINQSASRSMEKAIFEKCDQLFNERSNDDRYDKTNHPLR